MAYAATCRRNSRLSSAADAKQGMKSASEPTLDVDVEMERTNALVDKFAHLFRMRSKSEPNVLSGSGDFRGRKGSSDSLPGSVIGSPEAKPRSGILVKDTISPASRRRVSFASKDQVVAWPTFDRSPSVPEIDFKDRDGLRLVAYELLLYKSTEMRVHPDSNLTSRGICPAAYSKKQSARQQPYRKQSVGLEMDL